MHPFFDLYNKGPLEAAESGVRGFLGNTLPAFKVLGSMAIGEKYPEKRRFKPYFKPKRTTGAVLDAMGVEAWEGDDVFTGETHRVVDERGSYIL